MSGGEKPVKKTRGLLRVALSLVSLGVLVYVAIALITGRDSIMKQLFGLFSSREPVEAIDEYLFEVGRSRVYANLGSAVAAAGTLGVQVLDHGGNELLRDPYRMSFPAISESGGKAIAFDIGGTSVRVFGADEFAASFETESGIISASINENGWFCVNIQGSGGYACVVTVYNNLGKDVYKVTISSGYVLSSLLSPDNKKLAILSLTDSGSKITYYELDNADVADTFILPDRLIIDVRYLPDGNILAVTTDSLITIDKHGSGSEIYWFAGKRLGGYALGSNFIALHLLDYGIGYNGRLVTMQNDGTFLGTIATDFEVISMSSAEGYMGVLRYDGVVIYDMELSEMPYAAAAEVSVSAGATGIMALSGSAALATSDHSAVVIKIES